MISTGSLEPVDGGPEGGEPAIGWRAWKLRNNRLHAIGPPVAWQPGENRAECLTNRQHEAPAPSCHCGFWGLHNPVSAMQRAASVASQPRLGSSLGAPDADWTVAVGLMLGYGAIAVHGLEGFRAGLASVACIFSDAPDALAGKQAQLRHAVAAEYGVPCITLDSAISIGFLQEMGVGPLAIEQLRGWIAAGRPLAQPRQLPTSAPIGGRRNQGQPTPLSRREWEIARMLARGLTTVEIARSISLNLRAVDFHIYRLVEKTDSRNREQLVHWVKKHDR